MVGIKLLVVSASLLPACQCAPMQRQLLAALDICACAKVPHKSLARRPNKMVYLLQHMWLPVQELGYPNSSVVAAAGSSQEAPGSASDRYGQLVGMDAPGSASDRGGQLVGMDGSSRQKRARNIILAAVLGCAFAAVLAGVALVLTRLRRAQQQLPRSPEVTPPGFQTLFS